MKALRLCTCLLIACSGVPGFASGPGADADPLSGVIGLLTQEHQHSRPSTPPLSLAELETAALANNSEIRVAMSSCRNRGDTSAECRVVERPRVHVSRLGHTTR